jgi:hypothetical protein
MTKMQLCSNQLQVAKKKLSLSELLGYVDKLIQKKLIIHNCHKNREIRQSNSFLAGVIEDVIVSF